MSLHGKKIVVTGASKGLGLGIVRRLAQEGANIIAHYNSGDISEAEAIAREAGVTFTSIQADLSQECGTKSLIDKLSQHEDIYGLVNNAGVCFFEDFFDISAESFDKTFNINVKSVFLITQKVTQAMVKKNIKGRVVNLSSIAAISGSATQVHYGAAKGAIISFTKAAADALGKYSITVNAIAPGPIPTKHNSEFLAMDDLRENICDRMPLGEYGKPENIADAVVYLLGEGAGWTTGVLLPVDGGFLSK